MSRISRRKFIQATSKYAATASLPYVFSSSEVRAAETANSRPKIAVIGCGGQGTGDGMRALRFADVVAVCDVDSARAENAKTRYVEKMATKGKPVKIDVYEDYRAIVDRADIDAIVCGTVDHWHIKVSAEALRSGKDAYCEKPLTLTIDEGRVISKVVEDTGRILQVGTQQRSDERFLKAVAIAHSGRLGQIKKVTVGINRNPYSRPLPSVDPPSTLNWERWKGPTEDVPYRFLSGGKAGQNLVRNLGDGGEDASNCHYEFRWWYQYSGGKMTDWGAHHVDIAHWIIQQNGPGQGPETIVPKMVEHSVDFDKNGNPVQDDRYNVPRQFSVHVTYPNGVLMEITSEGRNGILVEGTRGRIFVNRGGLSGRPVEELKNNPLPDDAIETVYGGKLVSHMQNFFDCVATRKQPISDVWSHVAAINTCHLGNIAIRLNRDIKWDAGAQQAVGDEQANQMQVRPYRSGYEIEA